MRRWVCIAPDLRAHIPTRKTLHRAGPGISVSAGARVYQIVGVGQLDADRGSAWRACVERYLVDPWPQPDPARWEVGELSTGGSRGPLRSEVPR